MTPTIRKAGGALSRPGTAAELSRSRCWLAQWDPVLPGPRPLVLAFPASGVPPHRGRLHDSDRPGRDQGCQAGLEVPRLAWVADPVHHRPGRDQQRQSREAGGQQRPPGRHERRGYPSSPALHQMGGKYSSAACGGHGVTGDRNHGRNDTVIATTAATADAAASAVPACWPRCTALPTAITVAVEPASGQRFFVSRIVAAGSCATSFRCGVCVR
jgi:hypothetical protein